MTGNNLTDDSKLPVTKRGDKADWGTVSGQARPDVIAAFHLIRESRHQRQTDAVAEAIELYVARYGKAA